MTGPTTHPLSSRLRVPGESDPVVETAADELDRQAAEIAAGERNLAHAMDTIHKADAEIARLRAEVEALRQRAKTAEAGLRRVNDQAEHFEREWYLRGNEIEALRVDAERYRWLRDNPDHESFPFFDDGRWYVPYEVSNAGGMGGGVGAMPFDTLDAAIDAARNAEGRSDG